jgi:inosine-uridine nucleoside N-ribohydrolase
LVQPPNLPTLVDLYGKDRITRIVLMSGVFFDIGNVTPEAEFNAYCDPAALRDVLRRGIPVTLVPLDLCRKILLPRETVHSYALSSNSLTRLIVESHMSYMDFYREAEGIDGCFPHDTIAVLVACRSEVFHYVRADVRVDTDGAHRGRTRLSLNEISSVDVATGGQLRWVRAFLQALQTPVSSLKTLCACCNPSR